MAKLDEMKFDNLVYDTDFPVIRKYAKIDTAAGDLKKGTALQNDSNKISVLTSSGTPYAILAEDLKAGGGWASVYISGHFILDTVNEITGINVSDTQVDGFRSVGLYLTYAKK